jgi:hypothetical protein
MDSFTVTFRNGNNESFDMDYRGSDEAAIREMARQDAPNHPGFQVTSVTAK